MQDTTPAPRPLVWAALALATGAWAASPGVDLAWTALLALPGAMLFYAGAGPRPRALPLVLLAAIGGARAAFPAPSPSVEASAVGRWQPRTPEDRGGRLTGGGGPARSLPEGAARPGELLRLLPATRVRAPARASGDPPLCPSDLASDHAPDEVERLAPPIRAGPFGRLARAVRGRVSARLERSVREPARSVLRAVLLGSSSGLPAETRDLFTRTGTRHLLAVSGLHVGLFALVCLRPLVRTLATATGGGERAVGLLLVGAMLVYVPLAGGRAPVTRAGLALGLALLGGLVAAPGSGRPARRPDGASLLAAALVCECAIDPRAPSRAAVQLSYGATAGLLMATAPLARLLGAPGPSSGALPGHGLGRALYTALARPAARALAASLAASLATAPVVWSRFGEWSAAGIVATPALVPVLAALLLLGWLSVLGLPGAPALAEHATSGLLGALELLDRVPGTPLPLPPRPGGLLVGAALLAFAALRARAGPHTGSPRAREDSLPGDHPSRSSRLARGSAFLAGAALLPWTPGPRGLEVLALDVGHGTAVLARSPGATWVLDGGTRDRTRLARAMERRLAAWEAAAPIYVLTHGHRDHASALPHVAARFPPRLWVGALPAPLGERLPHVRRLDVASGRARLPTEGPLEAWVVRSEPVAGNEGSRTLSFRSEAGWVHLTGDADAAGLATVLDRGHLPGPVALLLVPHHGSDGSASARLIEETNPERAWISAAREPPLARELRRRGIRTHVTATDGPATWNDRPLGMTRAAAPAPARVDAAGPPAPEGAGEGPGRPGTEPPERASRSPRKPGERPQ